MRFGKLSDLARRFGKRDQKRALLGRDTRQKELQGKSCLSRAGSTFQEVEASPRQAAGQKIIQPGDPSAYPWWRYRIQTDTSCHPLLTMTRAQKFIHPQRRSPGGPAEYFGRR